MDNCAYPNTQSAAYDVRRWINEGHHLAKRVTARPFNFREPLRTHWLLIPSSEWPAYHHAKYCFRYHEGNSLLYTGFYVEKGLSPAVAEAYPTGRKLVMGESWAWHRFYASLKAGGLAPVFAQVAQACGQPVRLEVDGGFVEDPASYDPYAPPMDWNRASFDSSDGQLHLVESELKGSTFEEVVACQDLVALASVLARLQHSDWVWINLNAGGRFEIAPLMPGSEEVAGDTWDAPLIWQRCLRRWKPWLS